MNDSEHRVQMVHWLLKHQSMIQSYAYAIVRDFFLAEDVYQEVAMIVAGRWDELPQGEALLAWLRETTRRKALEARRNSARAPAILSPEGLQLVEAHFKPREQRNDSSKEPFAALQGCLGKLENSARRVIQARYGQGQSCEEIAAALERSVQSVYGILKRTRLALLQCVERALAVQE